MKKYTVSEISYSSGNKPIGVYPSIDDVKKALKEAFDSKLRDFDLNGRESANCTFSCDVSEC